MLTFFTPKEAEALLEEVKKIIAGIRSKCEAAGAIRRELDEVAKNGCSDGEEKRWDEFNRATCELDQMVKALEGMGCILRDLETGVVDFPAMRYGRQVYLCWKFGDRGVSYWHGVSEGYVGRKLITPEEKANGEKVFA